MVPDSPTDTWASAKFVHRTTSIEHINAIRLMRVLINFYLSVLIVTIKVVPTIHIGTILFKT